METYETKQLAENLSIEATKTSSFEVTETSDSIKSKVTL